jgi:hypothetical protein
MGVLILKASIKVLHWLVSKSENLSSYLSTELAQIQIKLNWQVTPDKLVSLDKHQDLFGSLLSPIQFEAHNYRVFPNRNFEKAREFLFSVRNRDRYYYPPYSESFRLDLLSGKNPEKVLNSRMPAKLHRPIATHFIETVDGEPLPDDFRKNDGALIISILEVIYETQLQYYTWWWIGRVRMDESNFGLAKEDVDTVFVNALSFWSTLGERDKRRFLNCCFHYARSKSYDWHYEEFFSLYMCIDSLWKFCDEQFGLSVGRHVAHKDRIDNLLAHFGMYQNTDEVKKIVDLRNHLFHEGSWGLGSPMGEANFGQILYAGRHLKAICFRVILAVSGQRNAYIYSNWMGYRSSASWK